MSGTAEQLWDRYRFFTKEMVKCLNRQDLEMFLQIAGEREKLQREIDARADKSYAASAAGKLVLQDIMRNNQLMKAGLERWRNTAQKQNAVASAYDAMGVRGAARIARSVRRGLDFNS